MPGATSDTHSLRLDQLLVERGLFVSRSRARDAILRGTVTVDGRPATRHGQSVRPDAEIAVDDPAREWVSRAALKLLHGLDLFGIDPSGANALDIGTSTGGFTQVLLSRGAARVTAIDVGHGQLHSTIANHPHVTAIEGLNARDLNATDLPHGAPDLIVCDVSFISLTLALPPALELAAPGAKAILLVKPQFEAGRDAVGKGGIVDPQTGRRTAERLWNWIGAQPGWSPVGLAASPIEGGDGNTEYLLAAGKRR